MNSLIAFLLGLSSIINAADVWQWDMIPADTGNTTNDDGLLGICYGSSTTWASYPYAAALRSSSGSACCSGSIVSLNPGVILTAAHCSGCTGPVYIGCSNPSTCTGSTAYSISSFVRNPSYGSPTQYSNDIAVVRLSSAITRSGATTITRYCGTSDPSGTVRVVGYGITQTGSIPTQLQTAQTTVVARATCNTIMQQAMGTGATVVDSTMICIRGGSAGQTGVATICSGDSGGPTSAGSSNQYGVTSWGLQGSGSGCTGCSCCSGYPQVLANVRLYCTWINSYISLWTEQYKENITLSLN